MRFKGMLLLALGAMPFAAHADWQPIPTSDRFVVTVGASVNGLSGQITYDDNHPALSGLTAVAIDVYRMTDSLRNELNSQVQQAAVESGFTFTGGSLFGDANLSLQPNGAGYLMARLSGLTYTGSARGTYRTGILRVNCTVSLHVRDIVATAQIGSATGGIPEESVGMTAVHSSNANCSSNLSWIPILGLLVDIYAEHAARDLTRQSVRDTIATMKDKLFFERDANAYAGLNRIVPADRVIPLPGGQSFAVGQWLHGQLAWILNNVNATIVMGDGAEIKHHYGQSTPEYNTFTGDVIRMNLVVGDVTLNIHMYEEISVMWQWRCTIRECGDIP